MNLKVKLGNFLQNYYLGILFFLIDIFIINNLFKMDDQVNLINKVLGNKQYRASGKINEGSYGQIFKVVKNQNQQVFALKALQKSKLQKLKKMHQVIIEIIILKKMNHPGIIRIFDVLQRDNYIGLVLELCPYKDLFNLMKTIKKSIELINKKKKIMAYYLAQILEAISYMHSMNIIHRDLKPQNIVLGEDLRIRIIDFGTAKPISNDVLTKQEIDRINQARVDEDASSPRKSLVGSANYLSPQTLKLHYSEKSDIWAFGIIAYKFYFNNLPFQGTDNMQIFKKIAQNQVVFDQTMDSQFKQLLMLCLKKDPKQRADARELKKCAIFKSINFQQIFKGQPPISKKQLTIENSTQQKSQFLFEIALQKKMFFGNFKPRLLTIQKLNNRLMMAYRYLPSRQVKNEFQLNLNDFAVESKEGQFEVVTGDKRYCFRCVNGQITADVVSKINKVIMKEYQL